MAHEQDFTYHVKEQAYKRQGGLCAYCGSRLSISKDFNMHSRGVQGEAHHLIPKIHNGKKAVWNCIYLCNTCHRVIGHGTGSKKYGIDSHGGSTSSWIRMKVSDFPYGVVKNKY